MSELEMQILLVQINTSKLSKKTARLHELLKLRKEYIAELRKEHPEKDDSAFRWTSSEWDYEITKLKTEINNLGKAVRKDTIALTNMMKSYSWEIEF